MATPPVAVDARRVTPQRPFVPLLLALFRVGRVVGVVALMFATWSLMKRLPLDTALYNTLVILGSGALLAAAWRWRRDYLPWAVLLAGTNVFGLLWYYADDTGWGPHFEYVLATDRAFGLGETPTVWLQQHFYSPGAIAPQDVLLSAVYLSFFVAPYVVFVTLWFHRRSLAGPFARALVGALLAGLAVIVLLPTAPPWMAAEAGLIPPVDRVAHELLAGVDSSTYEETYELASVNDVAAMPSIHTAVTFVIAVTLARTGLRGARAAGIAYLLAMGVALVYLGEHYVTDVLAGAAVGWLGWRIADRLGLEGSRERPMLLEQPGATASTLRDAA